ncbi:hypothetical protein TIFTF001_004239 [Ficus carica]|uniref:Uncharacterized protein n=1 Tax=Ficus carica TaxID=3494 RepID=A0AA88CXF5_FICCA|nr:hypothetical protein TIFTF001_004239 [Ficus carica]
MTDIAILVAEEFERRISALPRKDVGSKGRQETGLVSCVSVLSQSLKEKIGEEKMEILNWVMEPKTQIGLAASNGFFSA